MAMKISKSGVLKKINETKIRTNREKGIEQGITFIIAPNTPSTKPKVENNYEKSDKTMISIT
jgi:hypothetical protein